MTLLVIVPYRDRAEHLNQFLPALIKYFSSVKLQVVIAVIEQTDNLLFNRGALINAGFVLLNQVNPTHLCFHDVDCIPIKSDYTYQPQISLLCPRHVAGNWFSPVITCPTQIFRRANGFSNGYWGWGSEDADFFLRTGKKFSIQQDTSYIQLEHEHCSLLGGEVKPECIKNHERLMTFMERTNTEGLSTCRFKLTSQHQLDTKCELVKVVKLGVDLVNLVS